MFRNHLKIAWRNLVKDKQFTLLNVVGLSTGLACVLLIYIWVSAELSVDHFNKDDARLYQVMKTAPNSDGTIATYETAQGILASEMKKSFPEIEYAVSVRRESEMGILTVGDKHIKAAWEFADKDFFHVFSYNILEGGPTGKYGVMISDKLAQKFFHTTQNLVGKTFTWDGGGEFSGSYFINGVFEAPPATATDQFDMVFNYAVYVDKEIGGLGDVYDWGNNSVLNYVVLRKGADPVLFNAKIKDFTKSRIADLKNADGLLKWEGDIFLRKYSDKYLHDHYENGKQVGGRIEYVRLFSIIAIFILVIACINFMNLSTAKAVGRMKEVGIQKVIGASRKLLVLQYLTESMLLSFASTVIAVEVVYLLMPVFREMTGEALPFALNTPYLIVIAFVTGMLAGGYPAVYLSGFKPMKVLKGQLRNSVGESVIRQGLVVFQFVVSGILIIAVLVIHQQMNLIRSKNLGYDKDNVIRFSSEGNLQDNQETFLAELRNTPGVIDAAGMQGDFFGRAGHGGGGINWHGKDPNLGIEYYGVSGDYHFMDMLGLKMAEGRAFSPNFAGDTNSVIFNESAIHAMGIKHPIGMTVSLWGVKKQIVGVVKDFHFQSLYSKISPCFLECSLKNRNLLVKIRGGDALARIESAYHAFNQGLPFEYRFLDDDYQAMYAAEQRVGVLSKYFAAIAIVISCLGLFGLAAFTAQKRQKEIGIRKVIGASVGGVVVLLSKDFLRLVALAMLIAFPLAWWGASRWLQGFAYRASIDAGIFMLTGVSVLAIALLAVSHQAIKAARVSPAKILRSE